MVRPFAALAVLIALGPLSPAPSRPAAPAGLSPAEYHALRTEADALRSGDPETADEWARLAEAYPQDGRNWLHLARARYARGEHEAAIGAYTRAVELGAGQPWVTSYNLACCCALAGRTDEAFAWLEWSLAAGWEDRPFFRGDSDLASLHDDPRWPGVAGIAPPGLDRTSGWRHDLEFFREEVLRLHPDPFRITPEEEVLAALASLAERVPGLSDPRIAFELQRIIVLLGDGHSGVRSGEGDLAFRVLPLATYLFEDGLRVVASDEPALIGAEVLAIGSRSVAELRERLPEVVARDNPQGLLWLAPHFLAQRPVLAGFGAVEEDAEAATVRFRTREGDEVERSIAFGPIPPRHHRPPLPPAPGPGSDWLKGFDRNYRFEDRPELDAVYVQYNRVRDAEDESIAAFAERLDAHLADSPARNLILDIRLNNGGNSFLNRPIVRSLVHWEKGGEGRRIWALIGRNTFSAAQNFATDVDILTDALFVGEPSGARPNSIGESTNVQLPWSGLRLGISSRYHQQSVPGDERLWIPPDVPVGYSSADWLAGRDPALEALAAILAAGS